MKTKYEVQKCLALRGKLPSGVRVGKVWQRIGVYGRRATAETVAQRLRQDEHDNQVRVIEK